MQPNPEIFTDQTPSNKLDASSLYLYHNNNSTSRRQYSIPHSPRFPNEAKTLDRSQFYDLPSTISNRSPSFGYGNKLDLSKLGNNAPSPDSYQIPSQFQKSTNKGIKMGLGRELVKAVSCFDQRPFKIPGPGAYEVPLPKSNKKAILSGRIMDLSDKWKLSVPGPGAYKTLELLDNNLKSNISKFESCKSGKFGKGEERSEFDRMMKKQNYPSPAKYNSLQHFQIIDRFPRHKGRSFGNLQRPSIALPTIAPGPGSYNTPSDFLP